MTQPVGDVPREPGNSDEPAPSNPRYPGAPAYVEAPTRPYQHPAPQSWGAAPLAATATTEGTAVVGLVCAILSWLALPVVLAIVALVLARSAERSIEASAGAKTGRGLVTATRWIAWLHLLLVAMIIAFVAAFLVAVAVAR